MPDTVLDHVALEAYLPHRGVNLMPDRVVLHDGGTKATSHTLIRSGDARGRTVLGRSDGTWYEPMLAELMALTGVPLLAERMNAQKQVAVFSMISRISMHRLARLDREVIGHADISRDRGAFTVFATRATQDGELLLEAEVMSGSAPVSELAGSASVGDVLPAGTAIAPELFAWKPAHLRFADTVVSADAATGKLVTAYRYPVNHPFVPGHFPAGALMMGVTQWATVADAAWLALKQFGHRVVNAQGTIRRPDGREVLDVRDLEIIDDNGAPRITATKRIAFRDKIMPGEVILVEVTVTPK